MIGLNLQKCLVQYTFFRTFPTYSKDVEYYRHMLPHVAWSHILIGSILNCNLNIGDMLLTPTDLSGLLPEKSISLIRSAALIFADIFVHSQSRGAGPVLSVMIPRSISKEEKTYVKVSRDL